MDCGLRPRPLGKRFSLLQDSKIENRHSPQKRNFAENSVLSGVGCNKLEIGICLCHEDDLSIAWTASPPFGSSKGCSRCKER